jgi:hypothetical protein
MFYSEILALIGNLILMLIIWRGVIAGMIRRYPVFYGYVSFVFSASIVQLLVWEVWGRESAQYHYAYYLPTLLMPLLQFWVLWRIYRKVIGDTDKAWPPPRWASIFVAVMALLAGYKVMTVPELLLVFRYHAITLPVQVAICLVIFRAVARHSPGTLGRNVTGILLGMSLIVALQTINFTAYLFLDSSSTVFGFLVQFVYFLALGVFGWSLWDYRPLQPRDGFTLERMVEADEKLQHALRSFLSLR